MPNKNSIRLLKQSYFMFFGPPFLKFSNKFKVNRYSPELPSPVEKVFVNYLILLCVVNEPCSDTLQRAAKKNLPLLNANDRTGVE